MQGKSWRWSTVLLAGRAGRRGCGDDEEEESGGGGGGGVARRRGAVRPGTTLGKIQAKGEITIGVKYDVPPFGVQNPQTNEVEGFDVTSARPWPRRSASSRSSSRRSPTTGSRSCRTARPT